MRRLAFATVVVGAALGLLAAAPPPPSQALHPTPPPADTRCAACHTEEGWGRGDFAHQRTGFTLEGRHEAAPCKACHGEDYRRPLARRCDGCHVDPHAGRLGGQCQSCHTASNWSSRFDALAHRGTAFPLSGRHAVLPCAECHGAAANGRFSRRAARCVDCHQRDLDGTAGTAFDHARLELGTRCESCHGPWRFKPATVPGHDACFPISKGTHVGVRCEHCHTPVPPLGQFQACATGTANCTSCHAHTCAVSDRQHRKVDDYQCADAQCYDCHKTGKRK